MLTRRRTLKSLGLGAVLTALSIAVLSSAACAGTVPQGSAPAPSGGPTSARGTTPAARSTIASTAPSTAAPTAPPTAGPARGAPAGFPGAAGPYAEAVLAAWGQRQVSRLADLTTPAVRQQILQLPALADQQWTNQRCDGVAGSSYCSFINGDGDAMTVRVVDQQLGTAHAATEVRFDRTVYPNEAAEYVKGFIEAWRNSNTQRMRALASPAEVTYFSRYSAPDTYSVCSFAVGSVWQVRVYNVAGLNYLIRLSGPALGAKHAIAGHIDPAPLPAPCP